MICHFSSGVRSTRAFLPMLPPVGGPESYRMRQSSLSREHYRSAAIGPKCMTLPRDPENERGEKVCPSVLLEPGVV
jgi:hypothetical protein